MAIYKIWSKAYSRIPADILIAKRTEFIDTNKNEMFSNCKTIKDIKRQYESWWNISEHEEKVLVSKVKKVNVRSQGKNWGIKVQRIK